MKSNRVCAVGWAKARAQTSSRSLSKLDCAAPCPRGRAVLVGTAREIRKALKHGIRRAFAHPTVLAQLFRRYADRWTCGRPD
jgi:hypothetical protein